LRAGTSTRGELSSPCLNTLSIALAAEFIPRVPTPNVTRRSAPKLLSGAQAPRLIKAQPSH
ncbi:MAG: hypothetical protein ACYCUV_09220, partial [Phycisphaerae bacterium]